MTLRKVLMIEMVRNAAGRMTESLRHGAVDPSEVVLVEDVSSTRIQPAVQITLSTGRALVVKGTVADWVGEESVDVAE